MEINEKKREVSFSEDNHVDVKNEFITAQYPDGMKAADLKMLRFIISQCKKGDKEFFEYEFSASSIAEHFNMDKSNLIREARDMTEKRLFNCNLMIGTEDDHRLFHLFRECRYKGGVFTMQMDEKAADLFLRLEERFTEIPIAPILEMRNKNSIRIYELICQKFMGKYPFSNNATSVEASIEELRKITDTEKQKSYDKAGHFKERILNPALAEIENCADWKIIVGHKKKGKKVDGFMFEVWSRSGWEIMEKYKKDGTLPPILQRMNETKGQQSLLDYGLIENE